MRTSFELRVSAETITEAKDAALTKVADFLEIDKSQVLDNVNLELKVSYPEAKTLAEIAESMDSPLFVVTVYGSVKQSVTKPFGF